MSLRDHTTTADQPLACKIEPKSDDRKPNKIKRWWLPAALAGMLCLSCLLPLAGGLMVMKGLAPTEWQWGESLYWLIGGGLLLVWAGIKSYRKRAATGSGKTSGGCGC